ncbi:MAG: hypothetical protein Q8868_08940, partial [Bacteroidota bacterium]|nr:hypothetical protein [Bacteroidota bacterium]
MIPFSKRSYCFIILAAGILFALSSSVNCQYYTSGTDPGSLKWRQIKTPHFRLIYPLSFEKHAQYTANGLEYVYMPVSRTIHFPVPVMPVIIHNQTTIPSSVTPYAPRRMDFYTAPPQDLFPQDWVDQLLIHEFRHAAQYSAVNHGFTKALSFILGEQGTVSAIALFVPLWFVEGDATVIETALHYTGRGRTPSFEMRLRAQLVDKGIYTYEKAIGGSYRDFVPGKYELGYQIVGRTRDIYGFDIWSKVLSNVGRKPFTLVPFSGELKRQTGFNKYGLYDTLILAMQKLWKSEDLKYERNNYEVLTGNKKNSYISYNLPAVMKNDNIIAVKSGLDDLTKFIQIGSDGKEKYLFTAGYNFMPESISVSDSDIYWSEMTNDPRWTMRDYRVIKSFSFRTGKVRQLTHRTRYYAPSVSPDGKLLAAVEVTPENDYYLTILCSRDGSLLRKFRTPDNLLFVHPKWSDDGSRIVTVVFGKTGNNIALVDPESGNTDLLLPFSFMEIKRPSLWNNYILYTASYNGKDNIYALDTTTKEVLQVTSARFGASDAVLTNDRRSILYSNYTSSGYEIVKQLLNPHEWKKIIVPEHSAFPLAEKLTKEEGFIFNTDSVPKVEYKSELYNKATHVFHFHSWVPLGIDFENISASPGI